jgi:hypothetical protein
LVALQRIRAAREYAEVREGISHPRKEVKLFLDNNGQTKKGRKRTGAKGSSLE